jgi:hypothetical protein
VEPAGCAGTGSARSRNAAATRTPAIAT